VRLDRSLLDQPAAPASAMMAGMPRVAAAALVLPPAARSGPGSWRIT
jgi:hypothetical protein